MAKPKLPKKPKPPKKPELVKKQDYFLCYTMYDNIVDILDTSEDKDFLLTMYGIDHWIEHFNSAIFLPLSSPHEEVDGTPYPFLCMITITAHNIIDHEEDFYPSLINIDYLSLKTLLEVRDYFAVDTDQISVRYQYGTLLTVNAPVSPAEEFVLKHKYDKAVEAYNKKLQQYLADVEAAQKATIAQLEAELEAAKKSLTTTTSSSKTSRKKPTKGVLPEEGEWP